MTKELKDGLPSEKVVLAVEAVVTLDPAYSKGNMHFRLGDTCVKVKKEDGEEVGEICSCLGGGIEISEKESGKVYFIKPTDFWYAFINRTVKEE